MQKSSYILTIGGLDPCGGAGIMADIKTIEAHGILGMAVCTAITYQNDITFKEVDWVNTDRIIEQIDILFARFDIRFIKIGLIKNYEALLDVLSYLKTKTDQSSFIVWDPILKASAGFQFHNAPDSNTLVKILELVDLITPNQLELKTLLPDDTLNKALALSEWCGILLKGGHLHADHSNDILLLHKEETIFTGKRLDAEKRGTGCVLSSAILCNLALNQPIETAIMKAKEYVEKYLLSSSTRLGFHYA